MADSGGERAPPRPARDRFEESKPDPDADFSLCDINVRGSQVSSERKPFPLDQRPEEDRDLVKRIRLGRSATALVGPEGLVKILSEDRFGDPITIETDTELLLETALAWESRASPSC